MLISDVVTIDSTPVSVLADITYGRIICLAVCMHFNAVVWSFQVSIVIIITVNLYSAFFIRNLKRAECASMRRRRMS